MEELENESQTVTTDDKVATEKKYVSPSQKKLDEVNAYFARIDTDKLLQTLLESRNSAKTNDK